MLYTSIRSHTFQNKVVQVAIDRLAKDMGTKISIGGVEVEWWKTIVINDFIIYDQSGDTLIQANQLKVDYNSFDQDNKVIDFNKFELVNANVHFEKTINSENFNYDFFIAYFQPKKERDPNDPPMIWTINSKKVVLSNAAFRYRDHNQAAPKDRRFNENYFEFSLITGKISNLSIINDSISFKVHNLSTIEKSGFIVKNIAADTRIHSNGIELYNLTLETPYSKVGDELVMKYKGYPAFSDFIDKVELNANLQQSTVNIKDIAYFYEGFWGQDKQVQISGKSDGPISRLDINDLHATYGKHTQLRGNVDFSGLPDIQNTLIDCNITFLSTEIHEFADLLGVSNVGKELSSIGKIEFKGNLIGFTHDFVSRGNWKTNLGSAYTDLKFAYTDQNSIMQANYIGKLKTNGFNLAPLVGNGLGSFAGEVNLDGSGLNVKNMKVIVKSNVQYIEFTGKKLSNGMVDGKFEKSIFDGEASVKDKHLDMRFSGIINLQNEEPEIKIEAKVKKANLVYFGLDTGESILSGKFKSDIKGSNIDNLVGTLYIDSLLIKKSGIPYSLTKATLIAEKSPNYRNLSLSSSIADVSIKGDYSIARLPVSFNNFLWNLAPSYFEYKQQTTDEVFEVDVEIKKPALILTYVPQYISFSPLTFQGNYNSISNTLDASLNAKQIVVMGLELDSVDLKLDRKSNEALVVKLTTAKSSYESVAISDKLDLKAHLDNNNMDFVLNTESNDLQFDAKLKGNLAFVKDTITLKFSSSGFNAHDRKWLINEDGQISYHSNYIEVSDLIVKTANQKLTLNGAISKQPKDKLRIEFENLEPGKLLSDLNILTKDTLRGMANGWIELSNVYNNPLLESDFDFKGAQWNSDTLGNISIIAKNIDRERLRLDGTKITDGPLNGVQINGIIDLNRNHENFDLGIIMPKSNIQIASYFLAGLLSDIEGFAEGENLKLKGTFERPQLTGKVTVTDLAFRVDYLNTKYLIRSSVVNLRSDQISFTPTQIYDVNNQSALLSGNIRHRHFTDWRFNVYIDNINNMQLLNTDLNQNDLFYGQGYGTGKASITGPLKGIDIYLKVKTEKGTRVVLPLENEDAQTSLSYVHFKKQENIKDRKVTNAISNINSIVIDLQATKDAIAEMVFDSKVGDVLTGSGSGFLKLEVSKSGDFFMYGTYTIEEGKYLFTAFNFVNKPFSLAKGGTIFWDGDPYSAKINLTAVYKQKASLAPLIDPSQYGTEAAYQRATDRLKTPVDVESKIYLTGLLFSPKIDFDITFPNLASTGGSSLEVTQLKNKFLNDPQELNKQFLSLLVFNRFLPVSIQGIGSAVSSAPGQSASEMLSAQLNNWVSDLGIGVVDNISFNLGKDTANQRELVVSAEKSLFNERLTIRGAYGNRVGSNATNVTLEYNITKDGNLKLRTNYTPFYYSSLYTNTNQQGIGGVRRGTVGIFFRREFETIFKKND